MQPHLADLLRTVADRRSDAPLLTFVDPDRDSQTITAAQLDRDARRIAVTLHQLGVKRGDIVPLMFEHGYELIATFWRIARINALFRHKLEYQTLLQPQRSRPPSRC